MLGAAQLWQIHNGCAFHHRGAQLFQQLLARHHGATCGNQVVNQQHAVAGFDGIGVQLHCCAAVFQLIGFFHRGERQLAFFADGHKANVEFMSDHRTQNETACIQPGDNVRAQVAVHIAVHKGISHHAKDLGILQQRGDVAKLHAGSRPVRHGTDMVAQIVVDAVGGMHCGA